MNVAALPARPPSLTPIWWLLAALLLIRIAQSAARALQPLASHLADESLSRALTLQVLKTTERVPLAQLEQPDFHDKLQRAQNAGGTHKVLAGLNLEIRAGERLALVGVNGAGKTTLIKLLLGLYQPDAGRITIDGVPLDAIAPEALRAACAAVFQDYARFELSARDNIGFGNLPALHDDAHLLEAARLGGARELIERLPGGLDEVVGSWFGRGNLSGGEWSGWPSAAPSPATPHHDPGRADRFARPAGRGRSVRALRRIGRRSHGGADLAPARLD